MMQRVDRRGFVGSAVAIAVGVLQAGCGYTLAGRGNFLPSYIRVIGIPVFGNTTSVYDLEQQITQRVRSEFLGRGRYQVIALTDGADALLTGTIAGVTLEPGGFDQNNQATRYIIRVNLKVEFKDVKANKVLWENPSLDIVDEYDVTTSTGGSADASAFLGQNRTAADRIAETVARRTVSSRRSRAMTPRDLAVALTRGGPAPVYLVIGDDEVGKDEVVASLVAVVDEEDRAFNVERFTAGDADIDDVLGAARTRPMLGERRVVVLSHIERLFKGRRKAVEEEDAAGDDAAPADPGGLEGYVAAPEPSTVLVLVGTDINRSTRIGKALDKHAVTIACDGFNVEGFNGAQTALRDAMQFAAERARANGKRMDAAALTALVERAGPDIVRLRKDLDTLVLFVGDAAAITAADVALVVGAAQQFDDWAVTSAIAENDAAVALRHVQLMIENGSSPFQMLL